MPWQEYINVPLIKALMHHSSGTIVAIIFFKIVGVVIEYSLPHGLLRTIIETIEGFGLVFLFGWLLYQLITHLWKGRSDGSTHSIVVA